MLDSALFRNLLSLPFKPLPLLWLLILLGVFFYWKKKKRAARICTYSALAWLALISTGPLSVLLIDTLESQYAPLKDMAALQNDSALYILVLGTGHANNPALPVTSQLSDGVMIRLVEGIRLQKYLPQSTLVTSGAKGDEVESQAATVRKAAIELGIATSRVDTLSNTTNTRDEAKHFKEKFGTENKVVVVTDAVHMPRAMRWFKHFGLNPIPAPTHYRLKEIPSERKISIIPNGDNISKMEMAVHEYLGMLWMNITA